MQIRLAITIVFTACLFAALPVSATTLTFDVTAFGNTFLVSQDYGDRVTSTSDPSLGDYAVGAEGFTPNVVVDYLPVDENGLWDSGYSDLTNVIYQSVVTIGPFEIVLTADPGYQVELYGFDIGNFGTDTAEIGFITVLDETGTSLYSAMGVSVPGTGNPAYNAVFGPALSGEELTILVDRPGPNRSYFALDNITFGQVVPIPATLWLAISGLGVLGTLARRRPTAH